MPSEEKVAQATSNIRSGVQTLRAGSKEQLLAMLLKELSPQFEWEPRSKPSEVDRKLRFWLWIALCFLAAVAATVGVSSSDVFAGFTALQLDSRSIILFLGFVVALASYIANVGRELVKDLRAGTPAEPAKTKESVFRLAQVEVSLVLLGLLTMIYAAVSATNPVWCRSIGSQTISFAPGVFLISYLFLILLWLARLHLRVWNMVNPWTLYVPKPKN